jgi:dipeptidase E
MHRLVFYSDQIIPANQAVDHALLELLDKPGARVGYIASSSDPERRYFLPKQQYYQRYSLDLCLYVELDNAFDATLLDPLFACDAIHLSGGNTFYFLYWLQQRDLLARLRDAWSTAATMATGLWYAVSRFGLLVTCECSIHEA